jgi:hypothetical protein
MFSSQYSTITIFLRPTLYHYNISQANILPLQYFSSQYSPITIFLKPILYHYDISQANTLPLVNFFSTVINNLKIFLTFLVTKETDFPSLDREILNTNTRRDKKTPFRIHWSTNKNTRVDQAHIGLGLWCLTSNNVESSIPAHDEMYNIMW